MISNHGSSPHAKGASAFWVRVVKIFVLLLAITASLVLLCRPRPHYLLGPPSEQGARDSANAFLNDLGEGNIDAAFASTRFEPEVSKQFKELVNQHPALKRQNSRSINACNIFGRGSAYEAIVKGAVVGPHNSVSFELHLGLEQALGRPAGAPEGWRVSQLLVRADLGRIDVVRQAAALQATDPVVHFEIDGSPASFSP